MIDHLVKQRMSDLSITQAELARRSGLSTGHISDIVNGKKPLPSLPTVQALARALEVGGEYFFSVSNSHKGVRDIRKEVGSAVLER